MQKLSGNNEGLSQGCGPDGGTLGGGGLNVETRSSPQDCITALVCVCVCVVVVVVVEVITAGVY